VLRRTYILLTLTASTSIGGFAQANGVVVNDASQYDSSFIEYWGYLEKWGVQIMEDSIIVGGNVTDPIIIPTELPLNETLHYDCEKNGQNWSLSVERVSYTDIKFSIKGLHEDLMIFQGSGVAVLSPSFYLACAGVYEPSEDETFGMNNYLFKDGDFDSGGMLIPEGTTEMIGYSHRIDGKEVVLRFIRNEY